MWLGLYYWLFALSFIAWFADFGFLGLLVLGFLLAYVCLIAFVGCGFRFCLLWCDLRMWVVYVVLMFA